MLWHIPEYVEKALESIDMTIGDLRYLEGLLTKKEEKILEAIEFNSVAQVKLYIKEVCKMLDKRGKLPTEFKKYIV